MKKRNFTFTINNWKEEDIEFLRNLKGIKYIIWGKEKGEKGTEHLQGFVQFKSQRSVKGIVKVLRGHIEVAKGSPYQNFEYCSKELDFEERGERPKGQGKRSDIDLVKKMVKEGSNLREIYNEATSYQSFRMAEVGMKYYEQKRNFKPTVMWFWGPTGSGKTKSATEMCPEAWISGKNLKWWEGYDAHTEVILDDFRKDFCTFHELLRILDRYPYSIECKGSSRQLLARYIIITCPFKPSFLYHTREDVNQLLRRIDVIKYFGPEDSGSEVGGNNNAPPEFNPEILKDVV